MATKAFAVVLLFAMVAASSLAQQGQSAAIGQAGEGSDMREAILQGGTSIIDPAGVSILRLGARPEDAKLERVRLPGANGLPAPAVRVSTLRQPEHHWNVQANTRNTAAVKKGDVLLAAFRVRCVEPEAGEARAAFVVELGRDPYPKSVEFFVIAAAAWQQVFVPFVAERDYAIGDANISFMLGFAVQKMEIAEFVLLDYGSEAKLSDMPGFGYDGRSPDAPWRKAAAERIDKIRKADLAVTVLGPASQPVAGADVRVRMIRHAFPFGSAIAVDGVRDRGPNGAKYREFIEKNFNRIVFENDLKWHTWRADNAVGQRNLAETLDWLDKRSIQARGHCLVWPNWTYLPRDLPALKGDPAALGKRVADHVTEEVAALRGRLVEWDVINEPFTNHVLMDILGDEVMADWFKLARAADPEVKLFLNDYNILATGGLDRAHQAHFEKTIRFLLGRKAPIGGIGMQSHFGSQLTPPERMLKILDRFAALGLDIEVTEFDVDIAGEQLQADFTRDFYTTMFSHPAVTGILMWGFWEGRHWRPRAAMARSDWTLRPNGQAWMDLVHKKWTTDATGRTDAAGRLAVRGFMGDYEITVTSGGRSQTVRASLPKAGANVTVTVD